MRARQILTVILFTTLISSCHNKSNSASISNSAEFIADKFDFKGSRDSLTVIIGSMRGASVSVSETLSDI